MPEIKGAWISDDGLYRYRLQRSWGVGAIMVFIMLNPSTADANIDDPTVRRCIGFAKREGCSSLEVLNLYALRATKPVHLLDHPDPEGPENPLAWAEALFDTDPAFIVAAWGAHAGMTDLPPSKALRGYCSKPLLCLGETQDGMPRHPLYVKADQPLREWE
jgi:hypothetical protein